MCQGFSFRFLGFLHHFVVAKLAISSFELLCIVFRIYDIFDNILRILEMILQNILRRAVGQVQINYFPN